MVSPRWWGVVGVLTVTAATVVTPGGVTGAGAQGDAPTTRGATGRLDITSVTPWVAEDGVFRVDLTAAGAPLDASLRVTIGQPFAGTESEIRDDVIDSFDEGSSTDPLREPLVTPLSELELVGQGRFLLELPVRSTRSNDDRLFLPQPGVHPVDLELTDGAGDVLDAAVVYLNHLPPPEEEPARLSVALVAQAHADPLFDTAGEATEMEEARSQASLLARIAQLAGFRSLGVVVDPQILVALASSDNANDGALADLLESLLSDFEIPASPWVPLDTEAWASTGRSETVATSIREGRDAVRSHLGITTRDTLWPPDPDLGPASVELLSSLGVEDVIVSSDQWDQDELPRGRTGYTGSFEVTGGGASLVAMSGDPEIESMFEPGPEDAVVRAHRIATMLAATVLGPGRRSNGAVITIDTALDTDVLAAFVSSIDLTTEPLITVDAPSDAFEAARAIRSADDPLRTTLRRRTTVRDVSGEERQLARLRLRSGSQASMLPRGDPDSTRIANMLNSAQHRSLDRSISERLAVAETAIDYYLDAVTMPRARRVNVTSRRSTIPLRFENASDRTLLTRLVLSSPQLDFPDGSEIDLELEPGTNRVEVPTTARSSGEFVIDVSLRVRDGSLTLVERRQRVRSTAFSGVGLVLSGGALMFLVVWWYRTLRARDRDPDEPRAAAADH